MDILDKIINFIMPWLLSHGVKILGIIVGALVFLKFIGLIISKIIRNAVSPEGFLSPEAEKKREDTLIRVFTGTAKVLIWLVAFIMILSELGVNIGPVLAAAGVAGLAFGFGGQYLIRDVIVGFFVVFENQYRVGDVVCLDETCGLVEDITLRTTVLRDLDGTVHHVPNGEIKRASNLSKKFARVNLNVGVSYSADMEKVIEVVNKVGEELAQDHEWKEHIIKAPEFLRVDDFADSAVIIKILGETKPLKQWEVSGELRKRLKLAFDKEGIEIPFPQRVIHQVKS